MHTPSAMKRSAWAVTVLAAITVFGCDSGLSELLLPLVCPNCDVTAGVIEDPNSLDPNQLCDPNLICDTCDPNRVCDPNLICIPCDPNEVCDPNLVCPVEEEVPTLAGVWESTSIDWSGAWDDPEAPLAVVLTTNGNPFADMGKVPEGWRDFVVFDPNDAIAFGFYYDPASDILYVEPPEENPVSGVSFVLQDDGTFALEDYVMMEMDNGHGMIMKSTGTFFATPGQEEGTWIVEQEIRVQVTATMDMATDPPIHEGDQVEYTVVSSHLTVPSAWPALLFPDATWEIMTHEEEPSE